MKEISEMYSASELRQNEIFDTKINPNVVVVLIETSHPANIGSAARALKTMGLTQLRLVNPHDFPSARATWLASGATSVLDSAEIYPDFAAAVADCGLVIGTSARLRGLPWPNLSPVEATAMANKHAMAGEKVALVFGREARGLTNDELRMCQVHTMIPSNPEYGVLNMAAAVQLICYELRLQVLLERGDTESDLASGRLASEYALLPRDQPLAAQESIQGFLAHFEKSLRHVGFVQDYNLGKIMPRLERLFQRAKLDDKETALLRGLCSHLERLEIDSMTPPRG